MKEYTETDANDARRINFIFASLSEESKNMSIVYMSALRDREIADMKKGKARQQEGR